MSTFGFVKIFQRQETAWLFKTIPLDVQSAASFIVLPFCIGWFIKRKLFKLTIFKDGAL